ncbi:ABC transporter permease [Longispora sp. NPDC051575]|uniref:ABC transporter permease n=1 Tax=Longispora sp. NPDC051575 TaxID=3154943 RepID=UPI0034141969
MTTVNVIRAEWSKVWSLRSTAWSLLATAVLSVAIGMGAVFFTHLQEGDDGSKTNASLTGFMIGQLAICVLGVLIATGEYTTGQIRVTLAAVPDRTRFLLAKAVVAATVATSGGLVIGFATFAAGQSLLGRHSASLSEPEVLRSLIGVGLYSGVLGVFSMACGFLIRHSAGAISAVMGVLYIGPVVLFLLGEFGFAVAQWWPTGAGARIMDPNGENPWGGLGIFAGWTMVLLVAAWVKLRRSDA